jgi:hypothetical protein
MKKNITTNYFGKYEFVSIIEASMDRFRDHDKYRYMLDRVLDDNGLEYPSSRFFILDRKMNKKYVSRVTSGNFGKLISAYAIQLEKKRLSKN